MVLHGVSGKDGDTYVEGRKIGNFPIRGDFSKATHRVIIEYFKDDLDVEDYDIYDYLENQRNARGRIINNTIYVYDEETSSVVNRALLRIKNLIPEYRGKIYDR